MISEPLYQTTVSDLANQPSLSTGERMKPSFIPELDKSLLAEGVPRHAYQEPRICQNEPGAHG